MKKQCLECAHRTDCAQGLMTLQFKELLARCKVAKKKAGVTNNQLAEKSGVPVGTIERIMAGNVEDAKFSTVQAIVSALLEFMPEVGCPDDTTAGQEELQHRLAELEHIAEEKEKLERHLAALRVSHAAELETVHKDTQQRTAYLKGQLEKEEAQHEKEKSRSTRLLRGLIALGVFDILILAYDFLNPAIGFLRN